MDITLILAKNELVVNDKTYLVLPENFGGVENDFAALEFVTYSDCGKAFGLRLCDSEECLGARILLDKDGLYYYHKLYIPNVQYISQLDDAVGEFFVYKSNNTFIICQVNSDTNMQSIDTIIATSTKFATLAEGATAAYEAAVSAYDPDAPTQTVFITKKPVFSIWNLRKCLAGLQHSILMDDFKNTCTQDKETRYKRDFLFGAVYVLDYLGNTCNYKEAQRILDNLSSCGFLCGDSMTSTKTCCCGSTV